MIGKLLDKQELKQAYRQKLTEVRTAALIKSKKETVKGMELKKVQAAKKNVQELLKENATALISIVAILLLLITSVIIGGRKRKKS